jgi:hypothetical protein
MALSLVAGALSAIPSIVKLFDSDSRGDGVRELTDTVVNEASKALGVEPTKKSIEDKLNSNPEDVLKLRDIELKYATDIESLRLQDVANARETSIKRQESKDWLVRVTGSIIALLTILFAFALDSFILYEAFKNGITELNPIVTLIAGYSSARAIQVLSFYFGDSKVNADKQRSKEGRL